MPAGGPQSGPVLHETAQIWPEEEEEAQRESFLAKHMNQDVIARLQLTVIKAKSEATAEPDDRGPTSKVCLASLSPW